MNQKTTTEKVAEFHKLFEHPIGNLSEQEPLKIRQLRIKLLFEEIQELAVAGDVLETFLTLCDNAIEKAASSEGGYEDGDNVDKVEELDALSDIQYVLDGKYLTSGLHELKEKAFDLVHENNMNKAHGDMDHVLETVDSKGWGKEEYTTVEKNGAILLFNSDGKLTKPHDHKKVDLSILIPTV